MLFLMQLIVQSQHTNWTLKMWKSKEREPNKKAEPNVQTKITNHSFAW